MKTSSRNFVVEYKTARRQKSSVSKSIWGDTDLKAIAADVDSDTDVFSGGSAVAPIPAAPEAEETASFPDLSSQGETPLHKVGGTAPGALTSKMPSEETQTQSIPSPDDSARRVKSARHENRMRVRLPAKITRDRATKAKYAADPDTDEIQALLAENARLKLLMGEKLKAENQRLKDRLARFNSET